MPGVPSGRGCEGCRRQKKKSKPSCSRCARLGINCIGAGERRFKFITNHNQTATVTKGGGTFTGIANFPSSPLHVLAASMIETIRPSTDLRYNLAWSFGPFLEAVPQRLGKNEALDAAARALVTGHSNYCSRRKALPDGLISYSQALKKLRLCLDDAATAHSPETLCAVMLLLICQALHGTSGNRWTGHCEGAARLLKARGDYVAQEQDAFECNMLASLSASVLFEGILNPNIQFSPYEWEHLIAKRFDENSGAGIMMHCLSLVPSHLSRGGRELHQEPGLITEARANYQALKALMMASREDLDWIKGLLHSQTKPSSSITYAHAHFLRVHSINLGVVIMLNRVLYALDINATSELCVEADSLAKEIVFLAQEAEQYAPLGSSFVALCLCGAWIGLYEDDQKAAVRNSLAGYYEGRETKLVMQALEDKVQQLAALRRARSLSFDFAFSEIESQ